MNQTEQENDYILSSLMKPWSIDNKTSREQTPRVGFDLTELDEFKQQLLLMRRKLLDGDDRAHPAIVDTLSNKRGLLQEIEQALQRIEAGTYGICLATRQAIPKTYLKGMPWAKYCYED